MAEKVLMEFRIEPTTVYTFDFVVKALKLREHTLRHEIRQRRLRYIKRAGRRWLLGEHLLEWLRDGEVKRAAPAACDGQGIHGRHGVPSS